MTDNPLVAHVSGDPGDTPLAELKQHVLLFVEGPPGPKTLQAIFALYVAHFGDCFRFYHPTAFGFGPRPWSSDMRAHFEASELLQLRRRRIWGYTWADGRGPSSRNLTVHGYRPFSEAPRTSFVRAEFAWDEDSEAIRSFCADLLDRVACISGTCGYVFQGQPRAGLARASFDAVYAWARRYWGVEAQDLDVTVMHMRDGYKCVNWLTIIGESLAERAPDALAAAQSAAHGFEVRTGGVILQAAPGPRLGDRHRGEDLDGYVAIAEALRPLQVATHGSFGDGCSSKWDQDETLAWLRRFTEPDAVNG